MMQFFGIQTTCVHSVCRCEGRIGSKHCSRAAPFNNRPVESPTTRRFSKRLNDRERNPTGPVDQFLRAHRESGPTRTPPPITNMLSLNDLNELAALSRAGNLGSSPGTTMGDTIYTAIIKPQTSLELERLTREFEERRYQALKEGLARSKEEYDHLRYVSHTSLQQ
jgi:hypothetical protein